MNRKFFINVRHVSIWLVVVTGLLVAFLVCSHMCSVQSHAITQITDLSAKSEDGAIVLQWTPLTDYSNKQIEISIGKDEDYHSVEISASHHSYTYTEGEHGTLYEFSVGVKGGQQVQTASAMYLNFSQLPDLPLIVIETVGGENPTYIGVNAPAGAWGATITENDYIRMKVIIYDHVDAIFQSSGQIRVRGNTSAFAEKKPYKIKLDKKADLLFRNDTAYQDTEWVLLSDTKKLRLESGTEISYLCGSEWQPAYMPVNVMMNGNYVGSYLLAETIKVSNGRLPLSTNGFLIENDAYWWNKDGVYFRTPYQSSALAYTFQYPQTGKTDTSIFAFIRNHVTAAEIALMEEQDNYMDYIDVDSYAGWLLVHDIMGTWDSGGSNMYIHVNNVKTDSQLKLGPLWDFDSSFMQNGTWARIHESDSMHFDVLLQKKEFRDAYLQKWKKISNALCEDMKTFYLNYTDRYGVALQESWSLDSERWQTESVNIQESVDYVNGWFAERKAWLDVAMQGI